MSEKLSKTAIIAGASGLVGGYLLKFLLNDETFSKVIVPTRRSLGIDHPKIVEIICDYESLDNFKKELTADIVFCCLGTTIKKAGTKKAFKKIDHDYPIKLAQLTKNNGANSYFFISALSANRDSSIFYNQVKGQTQEDLKKIEFEKLHFIQPSLLLGDREEDRFLESFFAKVSPLLNVFLIGPLKKYQAIEAKQVAFGIYHISKNDKPGTHIHPNNELKEY